MERLTTPGPGGSYALPPGGEVAAIRRLGQFEDAYERLRARHAEIAERMEAMKAQGRQKSAQFRELLGEKLTIQNMLSLWETYGIR
ncbi:hypothetical protein [uncultured Intestinimonas sp.]|mgnify:FL=1|uniref:hypothetical protein n=1 Tax=uncultured Intestinimonas sp. TaxID=1689265 RepID=UPI002604331F|nr:hypothetical protein [uncultured Intestinimonas sp.]